eukprot:CAMPEP_0118654298 /NCGR_PEP_ID=MMETSP0785-20121206/12314_1 /TAXON_ID=91992 /ORGANISM="Bolidomonas pacifica, Strain CCMP 1866" /LENGTH=104 /DNA_ID=CAMNT_0006546947 /DNA_START=668 /DNA_END=982 /DNA_ORIENTATION=-
MNWPIPTPREVASPTTAETEVLCDGEYKSESREYVIGIDAPRVTPVRERARKRHVKFGDIADRRDANPPRRRMERRRFFLGCLSDIDPIITEAGAPRRKRPADR